MAVEGFRHVTIVGVGLLGGSLGLAMKALDPAMRVAGVGRRQSSLEEALRVGAIDEAFLEPAEPAAQTDLLILATPVGAFEKHLAAAAEALADRAVVTDVGSTKAEVVRIAEGAVGARRFVGSHPMAGSERKGVAFARADLFANARCILTPTRRTPAALTGRIERLWQRLGMRTIRMSPAAHDRALARVSHLPHVVAGLLMMLPKAGELGVSATGFRDTTRLASGDPEMWRDILMTNREAICAALGELEGDAARLRSMLNRGDARGVERFLGTAKKRRDETVARVLPDPSGPAE